MAAMERCASPDQMPALEPLSGPNSETNSLRDSSTPLPLPPIPGTLHGSIVPTSTIAPSMKRVEHKRDVGQFLRDVTAPLKLSLVLENKGNVARDHLASERTYLAYVRTSLACASAGVALVQLFMLSSTNSTSAKQTVNGIDLIKFAKPIGATVILFGLAILLVGLFRYFTTQSALIDGHFPVARNSITSIAFVLGSLVGVVFGIIVAATQR